MPRPMGTRGRKVPRPRSTGSEAGGQRVCELFIRQLVGIIPEGMTKCALLKTDREFVKHVRGALYKKRNCQCRSNGQIQEIYDKEIYQELTDVQERLKDSSV